MRKLRDHVGVLFSQSGVGAVFGDLGSGALAPRGVGMGELRVQASAGRCQVAPGRFLGLGSAHAALFPGTHISLNVHITGTFLQLGIVSPDLRWTHRLYTYGAFRMLTSHDVYLHK